MAFVITQNCCKDASCVPVCPVGCIRPVSNSGEFVGTEMLYIDPDSCIDCGACVEKCPVGAIHYDEELPVELERFKDINAAYFERHPLEADKTPSASRGGSVAPGALRVAIVGAGPAACYAATALINLDGLEVDMFERLPTPFGLIRAGVAPDHQHTKSVVDIFSGAFANKRFACHLNVEIGRDLSHDDLLAHHHAVIYAVGASASRNLAIPGAELLGNDAAADFVGWYNGHPDHAHHQFDLSTQRVVIVGNGNVALDVARVLLMDPEQLGRTDIAQHALNTLADSKVEEVVILGRRQPRDAAFSVGEFLALGHLDGVDVIIDGGELEDSPEDDVETTLKLQLAREYSAKAPTPRNKRIVFRFQSSPVEILGGDRVEGIKVARDGENDVIKTSLVLRSIGYKGSAIDGLPYEPVRGVVPNEGGRVTDDNGDPVYGVYVTGWIKRGPRGVIGTNRTCAQETVSVLWKDFEAGKLKREVEGRAALTELLSESGVEAIDWQGWRAIDSAEVERGAEQSRPRVKFVAIEEMLNAARA